LSEPGRDLPLFELGATRTPLRRTLVDAVLAGHKTATSSLRMEYTPHTAEQLPAPGDRWRLAGFDGAPLDVLIETTDVRVIPAAAVDLGFARAEGEGFATVEEWWRAHESFWRDHGLIERLEPDTEVVCERFRVVRD
jgi:uncharacterized protein YhfF